MIKELASFRIDVIFLGFFRGKKAALFLLATSAKPSNYKDMDTSRCQFLSALSAVNPEHRLLEQRLVFQLGEVG